MIGTTGPKISSFMIRISSSTPASTVGAMNLPLNPGTSRGPPATRSAPASSASSTRSETTPNWSSETIGPISVSHSIGSPTVSSPARRTTPVDEAVRDLPHHVGALDSRAGLPGVREAAPHAARDRVVQVGVGADDLRVLAAQLQHRSLELPGADLADPATDLDRAGEEDLPRRGLAQRLADRAAAVDDPDQPLRQARLLERLADPLPEQRRQAGRLEDDPVAGHQRHRDLVEGDRPRVVPGRDHADDPQRLVAELGLLRQEQRLAHADRLVVEDLRAGVRAPVKDVDRGHDLHRVALGDRLPLLAREQLGDLVELLDQDVGRPAQVAGPVGERRAGPRKAAPRRRRRRRPGPPRASPSRPSRRSSPVAGLKDSSCPIRAILWGGRTGRRAGLRLRGRARRPRGPNRGAAVFLAAGGWFAAASGSVWLSGWRERLACRWVRLKHTCGGTVRPPRAELRRWTASRR